MLRQYVESVRDFSSQYGSEGSISYTVLNLIGDQRNIECHDSSQSYLMRTYGPWWNLSSSSAKIFKEKLHHLYASQDFVELKYELEVYPSAIEIYERSHRGAVCKILACDPYTQRWHLLWEKKTDIQIDDDFSEKPFCPPLRKINFTTNIIRLEFHHSHLDYYAEIQSVCLIGFQEVNRNVGKNDLGIMKIFPQLSFEKPNSINHLVGLNAISSQFHIVSPAGTFRRMSMVDNLGKNSDTGEENYLEKLPKEVVHMIVKNLDLISLCRTSRCCRSLREQCYDPLLYLEIDLQPYWDMVSDRTLCGLKVRCRNVHRLNLSWCGNNGSITYRGISQFFAACGSNLTALYLSCCSFINAEVFELIAEYCSKLQELDLSNCHIGQRVGIGQISRLHHLRRLNLNSTLIDLQSLSTILSGCPQLNFLNLGSCSGISSYDEAVIEVVHNCRQLKGLEMWRARTLTSNGVRYLATLTQLEELDIGWCCEVSPVTGCLRELVRSCTLLRKLFLSAIRAVSDSDLLVFADYCNNLEQLDILGTREVTPAGCYRLLCNCPKLRLLDISFCGQIDFISWSRWKDEFPWVSIKRYN